MAIASRNLVRVYGDAARSSQVSGVLSEAVGVTLPECVQARMYGGSLLTAAWFGWPAESVVELIVDLSRRLPAETFELYTIPASPDSVAGTTIAIRAGRTIDLCRPRDHGMSSPDSLDLVAGAKDHLDGIYSYVRTAYELGYWCKWTDPQEIDRHDEMITRIKSVLTPAEAREVDEYRDQHRERAEAIRPGESQ